MNSYTLRLLYLSIFLFILRSFEMQKIWRHQWTKIMISKIMEKKGICQKSCRTTCHVWNGYIRKLLYKVSRIKREWYPLDISSNWKGCYWGKYFYFAMAWNFFFFALSYVCSEKSWCEYNITTCDGIGATNNNIECQVK